MILCRLRKSSFKPFITWDTLTNWNDESGLWEAPSRGFFQARNYSWFLTPNNYLLVVLTIRKNMKVNGKDYPIYYGKNKKSLKPPARLKIYTMNPTKRAVIFPTLTITGHPAGRMDWMGRGSPTQTPRSLGAFSGGIFFGARDGDLVVFWVGLSWFMGIVWWAYGNLVAVSMGYR